MVFQIAETQLFVQQLIQDIKKETSEFISASLLCWESTIMESFPKGPVIWKEFPYQNVSMPKSLHHNNISMVS